MAKDRRLSTYWLVAGDDIAVQIAERFHGTGEPGNWNYEQHLEMIRNAVVDRPLKEVTALVEWGLKQRMEATPEEPFLMGPAMDARAQDRGYGKYSEEIVL